MLTARRESCAGCASTSLRVVLDLGTSPLADRFPASPGEPERRYPLRAAVCTSCWLMQLLDVVPDGDLYGADYGFLTGASPSSLDYFASLAATLLDRYGSLRGQRVAEIACNDGTLLAHFADAGCQVLGIEPAGPPAAEARARGLQIAQEPFTAALGESIGPCAAHVADPADFLAGIRELLTPFGVAVVEFQYLGDLIAGCQFDHVYHEHRFFYSMGSFARLAAAAGLRVMAWEHTPAQGGSMRVTLARGEAGPPRGPLEAAAGRTVAGYGATAKSATLLNFCGIGPGLVPWVEDVTPAKIGRFTPGTHIPIVKPGDRPVPDTYLLLAWNYLGGVLRREREFTGGGGRFIVPGPVPVII